MADSHTNSHISLISIASEVNRPSVTNSITERCETKKSTINSSFWDRIKFKRKLHNSSNIHVKKRRIGIAKPSVTSLSQRIAFHDKTSSNTWITPADKKENETSTTNVLTNGHHQTSLKNKNSVSIASAPKDLPKEDRFWKDFSWNKLCSHLPLLSKSHSPTVGYKLSRKNSSEQFAHLSLLTPALILHPAIKGGDTITNQFSEKLADDTQLRLAAAHINDAINGYGRFGEARALFKPTFIQRCFYITSSAWWAGLVYFIIAIHCLMLIWEQPWKPVSVGQQWISGNIHPAVLVTDAICLLVYIVDITFHFLFLTWRHVWSAKENMWIRVEFIFTICFTIDFVILIVETVTRTRLVCPFRCFRASMLLCKSKNVAHIFNVLLSITTKLGKVFLIITIFIVTFASIGLHVFMTDYHSLVSECKNDTYSWNCTDVYSGAFDQVAIASMNMFVLMSTENYPEFIIPAFNQSWVNFFYFGIFLYAGVFFLTAILLAIIVESYWDYSKRHVKQERKQQREELAKAWNLMDPLGNGQILVDDPQLLKLFKILKPKNTDNENRELINYVSMYGDGVIDSFDWTTKIIETLSFEFEEEEPIQKQDEGVSNKLTCFRAIQKVCQRVMHATTTSVAILVLIFLHSILFCLMWVGITDTTQLAVQSARSAIVAIFVIEVILRIIAEGKSLCNLFDILDMSMVFIAFIGCITWYILWFKTPRAIPIHLGACVVLSGVSVLIRAVFNSQHARTAVGVLRNIYPVMFDLILLVLTIIFIYAVLGLEVFQDKTLEESRARGYEGSYVEYDCGVGFETFGCSLLIVFQIVTTNDWHEVMLGAFFDAGWPSVFYFLSCYLIVDMIVMNLFVAISIEAYKKLARDDVNLYNGNDTNNLEENVDHEEETSSKENGSFSVTARNTLTEIFAPSRKAKSYDGSSTLTSFSSSPYAVRRGTLGSSGQRTPTPTPRMDRSGTLGSLEMRTPSPRVETVDRGKPTFVRKTSLRRDMSSDDDVGGVRRDSPVAISESKHRTIEQRQQMLKRRGEKVRKRRRTKQEEKKLMNEITAGEQLSLDGVVRLKQVVRVIKAYRARNALEMNLREGDMIDVTDHNNHMLRGPNGWFPANHVQQVPKPNEDANRNQNISNKVVNEERPARVKFSMSVDSPAESRKVAPSSPGRVQKTSQSRMIRKKDGGDWRRDIHGEMTIMNPDELRDLSKMFRGGLGRRRTSQLRRVPTQLAIKATEQLKEEDEEEPPLPKVTVVEVTPEAKVAEDSSPTVTSDTNTLTLPVPERRRRSAARKKNKPTGDGSVPEWLQKFVDEKQVAFNKDVKLDDAFNSSPSSEDERELAYSRILLQQGQIHVLDDGGSSSQVTTTPLVIN